MPSPPFDRMRSSLGLPLCSGAPLTQGPQARGPAPPIVDRRLRLPWRQRLPARLGTAALWLGSCSLFGPAKLAALLVAGSLMAPCLLRLDRIRADSTALASAALRCSAASIATAPRIGTLATGTRTGEAAGADPPPASSGLTRAALAAQLGLPEAQLFRARHAAVCTVHHDAHGRIVALDLPSATPEPSLPSPDAHPVG